MKFKGLLFILILLFISFSISSIHADNSTDFSQLADEISSTNQSTVNLTSDYRFNSNVDSNLSDGVGISKNITIEGNDHIIDGSNQARGLYIHSCCNVVLDNITFSNCFSNASGGAIFLSPHSNLTLKNCIFKSNSVYNSNGGAVIGQSSTNINVFNCIFDNNTCIRESNLEWVKFKAGMGSAFFVYYNSNIKILNSTFRNNNGHVSTIIVISYDEGNTYYKSTCYVKDCLFESNVSPSHTVIYIDELGQGEILDSVFRNNRVTFMGGVITLESTVYTLIRNCLFENNHVIKGGALNIVPYAHIQSTADIINCNFSNNHASKNGGAIYANDVKMTVTNSNFYRNSAEDNGGAIFLYLGSAKLSNLNFHENHAISGGALYIINNDVDLKNSVLIHNSAIKNGGAIYDNKAHVSSKNNRFISNAAGKGSEVYGPFNLHISQSGKYYSDVSLKFKLTSPWNQQGFEKIKITFKGVKTYSTKWIKVPVNWNFNFKVPFNLKSGSYDVSVLFDSGSCNFNKIKVKVVKAPVKVIAKKIVTKYKSGKKFKIKVTNSKTGKAVSGVKFNLKVFKDKSSKTFKVKTNHNGWIEFDTSRLDVGKHIVELSVGDKNIKLSKKIRSQITIKKASATIIAPEKVQKHSNVKIKVLNKISKKPIKNTCFTIKIKSKTLKVKTSYKGIFKINSNRLNIGNNKITINLENKNYNVNNKFFVKIR